MARIESATLPWDEGGNDPNDWRDDPDYLDRLVITDEPEQPVFADPTEDGLAQAFAKRHRNALRYDHTRGCWYQWDGARWKEEKTRLAFDWADPVP